jgi:riboflavin kinase/FMN adenylyltransferase
LTGTVVHGKELGRTIGFPTANIYVSDDTKLIPANGVYAVRVNIGTAFFNGMLNIGNRPTVSTTVDRSIEVHIFDFDSLIYDAKITIEFIRFIRQEKEFSSIEVLRSQLQEDEQAIRAIFNTSFKF